MLCALASGLHDPALMLICIYATKSQAVRVCACLSLSLSLSLCLPVCMCVCMDGWMDGWICICMDTYMHDKMYMYNTYVHHMCMCVYARIHT